MFDVKNASEILLVSTPAKPCLWSILSSDSLENLPPNLIDSKLSLSPKPKSTNRSALNSALLTSRDKSLTRPVILNASLRP